MEQLTCPTEDSTRRMRVIEGRKGLKYKAEASSWKILQILHLKLSIFDILSIFDSNSTTFIEMSCEAERKNLK